MNEITPITAVQSSALTLAESPPLADSLLNFIARAVTDPTIDLAKLESLLAMHARLRFDRAMSAAQGEMQPVLRNAQNIQTSSRYATLDAVDAAIRPIYARHGFSLSFTEIPTDGATVRIACIVRCAGHVETYHLEAAADTVGPQGKPNKTPVQGVGSSVTYLRRYLMCMVFNIALTNEDNDGNRQRTEPGRLTAAQVAELNALMVSTRTLEAKFLAAMCPELRAIVEAPASDFVRLRNALLTKKSVLQQRWRLSVQQEDAARAAAQNGESA